MTKNLIKGGGGGSVYQRGECVYGDDCETKYMYAPNQETARTWIWGENVWAQMVGRKAHRTSDQFDEKTFKYKALGRNFVAWGNVRRSEFILRVSIKRAENYRYHHSTALTAWEDSFKFWGLTVVAVFRWRLRSSLVERTLSKLTFSACTCAIAGLYCRDHRTSMTLRWFP